nr:PREDICTED: polygalacturonase-like [Musa acuminata subsp. malaccensis]
MADGVYNVKDYGAAGDGKTDNTKVVEDSTDKELLHGLTTNAKRQMIANPYPCFVTNATIKSISSIDSKFFHIHVFESRNIIFDSIKISAPQDSPNTDGIHIADSTNIQVANSVIGTGDDCISIGPGCTNLTIFKVLCGPGHGISVGSLGKNAGEKDVIGLNVSNCNLTGFPSESSFPSSNAFSGFFVGVSSGTVDSVVPSIGIATSGAFASSGSSTVFNHFFFDNCLVSRQY